MLEFFDFERKCFSNFFACQDFEKKFSAAGGRNDEKFFFLINDTCFWGKKGGESIFEGIFRF